MGVFDIEELGRGAKKTKRAVVARPRDCTMCRECIRREGWDRRVALKRVANHFIFTVESTGILPPEEIVKRVRPPPLPHPHPVRRSASSRRRLAVFRAWSATTSQMLGW
jgi:DNA-directed RNA polymerase alpha subunit